MPGLKPKTISGPMPTSAYYGPRLLPSQRCDATCIDTSIRHLSISLPDEQVSALDTIYRSLERECEQMPCCEYTNLAARIYALYPDRIDHLRGLVEKHRQTANDEAEDCSRKKRKAIERQRTAERGTDGSEISKQLERAQLLYAQQQQRYTTMALAFEATLEQLGPKSHV